MGFILMYIQSYYKLQLIVPDLSNEVSLWNLADQRTTELQAIKIHANLRDRTRESQRSQFS